MEQSFAPITGLIEAWTKCYASFPGTKKRAWLSREGKKPLMRLDYDMGRTRSKAFLERVTGIGSRGMRGLRIGARRSRGGLRPTARKRAVENAFGARY
ncbi:MAG: hypothetical protein OXL41_10350 [Nitrospinae bacterium]|nr:hypothetical protein [Nitrospinota bacterium]